MKRKISLKQFIESNADLPTLSPAVLRVMNLASRPESTGAEMSEAISVEPSLAAKVLKCANSAYYGLPGEVTTLQAAVILLGLRTVRNLAMAAAAQSWFGGSGSAEGGHEDLWQHSLGVAGAASAICSRILPDKESEAFCTGLLHDVGKIALRSKFKKEYRDLPNRALQSGLTQVELESQEYGFDHAQLGFHLAQSWNLPSALADAIRDHHQPDTLENGAPLTDIIHVANYLVWKTCEELASTNGPVSPCAIQRLGFASEEDFGWVTESIEERQKRLSGLLQAA